MLCYKIPSLTILLKSIPPEMDLPNNKVGKLAELADIAKQAKDVTKAKDDGIEEIADEVVPNTEYESMSQLKDDPPTPTESNPAKEHPPPVRDRSLGGIDYDSLSYDDPIFKNGYN